jgi:hypothetical protein
VRAIYCYASWYLIRVIHLVGPYEVSVWANPGTREWIPLPVSGLHNVLYSTNMKAQGFRRIYRFVVTAHNVDRGSIGGVLVHVLRRELFKWWFAFP